MKTEPSPVNTVDIVDKNASKKFGLSACQWQEAGKQVVDYIADYIENVGEKYKPQPNVKPGWLKKILPEQAPEKGDEWDKIFSDFLSKLVPGMSHWLHPQFGGYFCITGSYAAILGDTLTSALASCPFSWIASPLGTELEMLVMDWIAQACGLPEKFLFKSTGGGVNHTSASDCVYSMIMSARYNRIKEEKAKNPGLSTLEILDKLVAYCSSQTHSSTQKGCSMALVKLRILDTDENERFRPDLLEKYIKQDKEAGLIPFLCVATIGTTACCSIDPIAELGKIAKREGLHYHVDAAYAGSALICPELRKLAQGMEYADSFNFNGSKWMLSTLEACFLWVADRVKHTNGFIIDPTYLQHNYGQVVDYRNWGVHLTRRCKAIKLWIMMRSYGLEGIRNFIRRHVELAKQLTKMLKEDGRFEICAETVFGLVCFRLKGKSNAFNQKYLETMNETNDIFMVPSTLHDKYVIRFCIHGEYTTLDDVKKVYKILSDHATKLLKKGIITQPIYRAMDVSNENFVGNLSADVAYYCNRVKQLSGKETDIIQP